MGVRRVREEQGGNLPLDADLEFFGMYIRELKVYVNFTLYKYIYIYIYIYIYYFLTLPGKIPADASVQPFSPEPVVTINLLTVLSILQTTGLRLHVAKCSFLENSCVYLGHRLDAEGIHTTTNKLIARANVSTELRSYLVVNKQVPEEPRHSFGATPQRVAKRHVWHWVSEQANAFVELNMLLQSSQVLVYYDPKLPVVLSCDVRHRSYAVASCIRQMEDGRQTCGIRISDLSSS